MKRQSLKTAFFLYLKFSLLLLLYLKQLITKLFLSDHLKNFENYGEKLKIFYKLLDKYHRSVQKKDFFYLPYD